MTSTLLLGIDIGWSEKKRSSAVAAFDPLKLIKWPKRAVNYADGLSSCCFRFTEVVHFLSNVQAATANYDRIVAVFDGPIGPNVPPHENRYVDGAFRRGEFNRRMQPADVSTEQGQVYVNATYETIQALVPDFELWLGGELTQRAIITETNPTVGLALMNKKFVPDDLPARNRPLMPPSSDRASKAIRAKSDFYWRSGGAFHCSNILGSESITAELDHERVAAIYCLTVAASIAYNNYCACGHMDDGIYIFPADIHPDWTKDIQSVGVVAGQLRDKVRAEKTTDFSHWNFAKKALSGVKVDGLDTTEESSSEVIIELVCKGDEDFLLLNDNGGVWQAHNDWLSEMRGPILLESLITGERLKLTRGKAENGQWRCEPKTNETAANHGLNVPHLSKTKCVAIPVKILAVD